MEVGRIVPLDHTGQAPVTPFTPFTANQTPTTPHIGGLPPEVIRQSLELVTQNELASALGVQTSTLAVWRSTGEGPRFVKLGKQVFYRLDDLTQWVWSDQGHAKEAAITQKGTTDQTYETVLGKV